MIRRGRAEGWLKQPISALPAWAEFNGVKFNGIKIGPMPGFEDRGSTVIAKRDLSSSDDAIVLTVPRDLIISKDNIELLAKADQHFKEVLDALGEFGRTTRGVVLAFLLMQATIACPDVVDIGVRHPLNEYVKYLPDELLPTTYTEDEQELLEGTTLRPAVRAKLNSLLREFENVRTLTEHISWCAKYWWDEDDGLVTFEDWMCCDAMYRSRALEFPGVGDCMVPCVDMANHASGEATAALYETDGDGNGVLQLRAGKDIKKDGEITITYGDEKGACENIFSYGFLEDSMTSAKVMFLDLDIPDDDPLRPAKLATCTAAPGFRLFEQDDRTAWESDFIWLVVVNEEDGLEFKMLRTIDGGRELKSFWKEHELNDTSKLRDLLQADSLWEIFQLRAVVLLQSRVESQMQTLQEVGDPERGPSVREIPWTLAKRLRNLEYELLDQAAVDLEKDKTGLLESDSAQEYLGLAGPEADEDEIDFT